MILNRFNDVKALTDFLTKRPQPPSSCEKEPGLSPVRKKKILHLNTANDNAVSVGCPGPVSILEPIGEPNVVFSCSASLPSSFQKAVISSSRQPIVKMQDVKAKPPMPQEKKSAGNRSSDDIKSDCFNRTFHEFCETMNSGCNSNCFCGKQCLSYMDMSEISERQKKFWGLKDDNAPTPAQRRTSIENIFDDCRASIMNDGPLTFQITDKFGKLRQVCEASFLYSLGYIHTMSASDASSIWKKYKMERFHLSADDPEVGSNSDIPDYSHGNKKLMTKERLNAQRFLLNLMSIYGDTLPTKEGTTKQGKTVKVLPYPSRIKLFEEYKYECDIKNVPLSERAEKTCFFSAFSDLCDQIRLLGCKGSLPTCNICNRAHAMLRSKKWTKSQKEIILAFMRLHLKQQMIERMHLENTKDKCRTEVDENGFFSHAFIYSDAMTLSRGSTPLQGEKNHRPNQGRQLENRLFAVEVVCGPINLLVYVSVDGTIRGGANLGVEITRVGLECLRKECELHKMPMPGHLHLQFDNCGENKNKEMFCYVSLLVESGFIKDAEINFLVVGHTHCNLDQEFSCVSKRIDECTYIGSPLAMQELYMTVHNPEASPDRKCLSIYLRHTYDWKEYFKCICNGGIKYFQVPHRFKIFMPLHLDRAIMQYSLFTNESLDDRLTNWLPKQPVGQQRDDVFNPRSGGILKYVEGIKLESMSIINGLKQLQNAIGLYETQVLNQATSEQINNRSTLADGVFMKDLKNLEAISYASMVKNLDHVASEGWFEDEIDRGDVLKELESQTQALSCEVKAAMQLAARKGSDLDTGYIIWLDYRKADAKHFDPKKRPDILPNTYDANDPLSKTVASHIAAVCKDQLNQLNDPKKVLSLKESKTIQEATSNFREMRLHQKEKEFFEANETKAKVLENIRSYQMKILSEPWELYPLPKVTLSSEQMEVAKRALIDASKSMADTCASNLVRKLQGHAGEVLTRGDRLLNAETIKGNQRRAALMCIVGYGTSEACPIEAQFVCEECSVRCCISHFEHSEHSSHSGQRLRQNVAILLAPEPNIPTETPVAKAPGKTSWAYWLQVYQELEGKPYVRQSNQKLPEFMKLVKDIQDARNRSNTSVDIVANIPAQGIAPTPSAGPPAIAPAIVPPNASSSCFPIGASMDSVGLMAQALCQALMSSALAMQKQPSIQISHAKSDKAANGDGGDEDDSDELFDEI